MPPKLRRELIRRSDEESDEDFSWSKLFKLLFEEHEFLISLLCFLVLIVLILIFFYHPSTKSVLQTCGDGSFYDSCSIIKPYYCSNHGFLSENASVCGCAQGWQRNGNTCTSPLQTGAENIPLSYILNGQKKELNFTVYQSVASQFSGLSRAIYYNTGEKPLRADFAFQKINEETQREFLLPLVIAIQNITKDRDEQALISISIVQNIPYGFSNKTTSFMGNSLNYSRYPYEVLSDFQGICGEKSELLAFLLRDLGYGTVLFYNQKENHESVGIKCPVQYSYKQTGYCFVETTGPAIVSDDSIQYIGGITLESNPEVILISTGDALGSNLQDYKDAQTLKKLRAGRLVLFPKTTFERLKEKYGLIENYQIV